MDGEALTGAHGAGWKEVLCEVLGQEAWPRAEGLEEGMGGGAGGSGVGAVDGGRWW
jgi:hypothetical protein